MLDEVGLVAALPTALKVGSAEGGGSEGGTSIAAEVLAGLTAMPKTLPSKLFYDDEGLSAVRPDHRVA